jgi:hypothetical protein
MSDLLEYATYIFWWFRWLAVPCAAIVTTVAAVFGGKGSAAGALGGALLGWLAITAIVTYVGWKAPA